jgi:HEAT repeat protein
MLNNAVKKQGIKPTVIERVSAVMSLAEIDNKDIASEVKRYLADQSPTVRAAAIEIVRKKNLHDFEKYILALLSDKNHAVRYSAAECIGAFHEDEGIAATWLYPLLQDPNELVRIETLESLERIGDKKAVPLMVKRIDDDRPLVRSYAARFVADLGGKQYLQTLVKRKTKEKDDVARVGLAYALFSLGDSTQLSVLLELLSSANYTVRCAAANSLSALKFTPAQRQAVLAALAQAAQNALAVADRSTMERVEKELRDQK